MTLIELVIVISIISIIVSSGYFIFFSSYKSAIFYSALNETITAISQDRNESMLNQTSTSITDLKLPDSIKISRLEQIDFVPLSGLPKNPADIALTDGIHFATITINKEGGISY